MHKFDLQRALAGEPLITRGGLEAVGFHAPAEREEDCLPFAAQVGRRMETYTVRGTAYNNFDDENDLFMLHETSGNASDSSATQDPSTGIATGTPVESGFSSWQPIETMEKGEMQFVLTFEDGAMRTMLWNPRGHWERPEPIGHIDANHTPRHWMPLPAPPTV